MKKSFVLIALMAVVCTATPALAQVNVNKVKATGGNASSTTGHAIGVGNSAVVGSGNSSNKNTNSSTNTNVNSNRQGQRQGQAQGQGQEQGQGQAQGYQGEQSVSYGGTNFDRYAPSVAAPALTAAGTGVCLGSFSVGLAGPMAGASFGKTTVDKGCEKRSEAALLFNMGHQKAALRVLAGESITEALAAEGALPVKTVAVAPAATAPLKVDEAALQSTTNFGQVQGN